MFSQTTWSRFVAVVVAGFLVVPMLIGGCPSVSLQNITETVQADESLSIFSDALQTSGLDVTLRDSTGPYTVFVPTDAAFNSLPAATRRDLLTSGNLSLLTQVLKCHVVVGRYQAGQLRHQQVMKDMDSGSLVVRVDNGVICVGGAPISQGDIPATNGIIHVLGKVILPPGM